MELHPNCPNCPNHNFTLFFNPPEKRLERVECPRWAHEGARLRGDTPLNYVSTEVATCNSAPFEFCPSCPAKEELDDLGLDKAQQGWYSLWRRVRELLRSEEDDG